MPEFGFPAQPQVSRLNTLVARARRDSDNTQIETVTGRPADLAATLDGRVSEAMLIEKALIDLDHYAQAIALAEARAAATQQSLDQTVTLGQELTASISTLLTNGTVENLQIVSEEGRAMLDATVAALNTRFAGRALFSGDASDQNAVIDATTIYSASTAVLAGAATAAAAYSALTADFVGAGGLFDTTFYTGGTGDGPQVEIAPGETVDYALRADEEAVRRMLLNTVIIAAAYDTTNAIPDTVRKDLLATAADGLREAMDQTINLQGRLGAAEARIATVKARNIAEDSSLAIQFNELAGVDRYEAGLRLSDIEAQLETAFYTTARLSRLSLTNYL